MGQEKTYRKRVHADQLVAFQVLVKETDLMVHARRDLTAMTRELVLEYRHYLERYIENHPDFATSLRPWRPKTPVGAMIGAMIKAATEAGVGPMAAVAGALAQSVAQGLMAQTDEVIVENGGDTFICTQRPVRVGIFAGASKLSLRLGLRIPVQGQPIAVCTSSGTIGHSLSMGRADAVCVVSQSAALADAVATALGNQVQSPDDIGKVIEIGKTMAGVEGLVVIIDEQIGFWGELDLVGLKEKRVEFSQ